MGFNLENFPFNETQKEKNQLFVSWLKTVSIDFLIGRISFSLNEISDNEQTYLSLCLICQVCLFIFIWKFLALFVNLVILWWYSIFLSVYL